jgi:hypothetical protein
MTNLQLLPVKPVPAANSNAQIVTLDRTDNQEITLRFLSRRGISGGYGRREVTLDADVAEQLLSMLSRELDGDMVMG